MSIKERLKKRITPKAWNNAANPIRSIPISTFSKSYFYYRRDRIFRAFF